MALEHVKAEAAGGPVTVTFRSAKFVVQPPDVWLFDFTHHLDRQEVTLAFEAMLGAEGYKEFRALKPSPRLSEMDQLMQQILTAFGVELGESAASTGS